MIVGDSHACRSAHLDVVDVTHADVSAVEAETHVLRDTNSTIQKDICVLIIAKPVKPLRSVMPVAASSTLPIGFYF